MVNFGYPYNDIVICKDSTDYLSKNRYVRRLGRDSFAFRVVNPWNKLPLDVVMAPNLNSFKSRLNVHYKNFPLKFCPSFMSAR